MKVLFAWNVPDDLRAYFRSRLPPQAEMLVPDRDMQTILNLAGKAEVIVAWNVTEELLASAPAARLVIIPAVGVERQLPIVKKFPGLICLNSHGNALPTAEHALALVLAVTRHVTLYDVRMRNGQWRAFMDKPPSLLLNDLTAGILGMGAVGSHLALRLKPCVMMISGCSRSGRPVPQMPDMTICPVERIRDFLAAINILVICVPNTPQTDGMIGDTEINLLLKPSVIVNVARGAVIQEHALYDALKTQRLWGAGLDVWYNYSPEETDGKKYPYSLPFHELDNVTMSPHRGASPLLKPQRFDDVLDNIGRFMEDLPLTNVVDPERGY